MMRSAERWSRSEKRNVSTGFLRNPNISLNVTPWQRCFQNGIFLQLRFETTIVFNQFYVVSADRSVIDRICIGEFR